MTDPAADAARAAAAILAPDLGPNLPAEVEAALAARDTQHRPDRYVDPVSLATWSTPGLVETRFSPDALVWVGRCLPRYRRLAEPRSDHFSALFYRTSVQLRCPAAPPGGGLRPPGRPGGLGISSSGTPHCAAGSPGWSRVTLQRHRLRRRRRP